MTACASGIGKEIASAYAAIGAQVCVCDINEKALDTAAKDISGLKTIVCDVSKREDIKRKILISDAEKSISGLVLPIDNYAQTAT